MQFDQYLATFEFFTTQVKSDHLAEQTIRRPQNRRLFESLLCYCSEDGPTEYKLALRPRHRYSPLFVPKVCLQWVVRAGRMLQVECVTQSAQ